MTDKCRGYLVTAPVEARMDLWAATAMFTNWLEGRGPEERMTWHVMCYDSGAEKFLSAARTLGLTVERIDGAGDSEQYVLLAGEPGSGWQR